MSKLIKDITEECTTKYIEECSNYVIHYKNVPLLLTIYNNDPKYVKGMSVEVRKENDDCGGEYYILVKTPIIGCPGEHDFNTCGTWYSKETLEQWLERPEILF